MIIESLVCIAVAVYFEARGEPSAGQLAVAQVVRNRIESSEYPDDACDVVKQGYYWNEHPVRNRCQFSFWCDGKSDNPRNTQLFYNALYIAWLSGEQPDTTAGATHYHNTKVYPQWAYTGTITTKIHEHIFYREVE
jgi:spore germination cell wall hydrolase CwlJ-like protein